MHIKKALLFGCIFLSACVQRPPAAVYTGNPAPLAVIPARQIETQKITLGNVQRIVKKGASSSEVIEALSSPNIVTSNPDNTETWVYDKVLMEKENATGDNGSVEVKSTRTMIVVIKFDKNHKVDNVQYRQTSY